MLFIFFYEYTPPIQPSNAKLKFYTGEQIKIEGSIEVEASYQNQRQTVGLVVVVAGH